MLEYLLNSFNIVIRYFYKTEKKEKTHHEIDLKDLSMGGALNIFRNVGKDTYDVFYDRLIKIPDDKPLVINIETDGGSACRLIKIMRNLKGRKNLVIAHVKKSAHSAGAVLALSCDELHMSDDASLSAIDPQSSVGIEIKNLKINSIKLIPLIYDAENKKEEKNNIINYYKSVTNETKKAIISILNKKHSQETINKIIEEMFDKPLTHEKLFFKEDIISFGVDVKSL